MRPVRFAPCAAGARPTTSKRAAGSPNPGTGFPQYVQSRNSRFFSRATRRQWRRSRGQRPQATIARLTAARLVNPEGEAVANAPAHGQRLDDERGTEQPRAHPRGGGGCDGIVRSAAPTDRCWWRAPETSPSAASSLAARWPSASRGSAASALAASSTIATCLISGVACSQGWCHARGRSPWPRAARTPPRLGRIAGPEMWLRCDTLANGAPAGLAAVAKSRGVLPSLCYAAAGGRSPYRSRIPAAIRSALARIVRLVFTASEDGMHAPSLTYRPGQPNTAPFPSTTPPDLASAMRHDPTWWAVEKCTPASGARLLSRNSVRTRRQPLRTRIDSSNRVVSAW